MILQRSHPHDHTYAESMQKYHILKIRKVGLLLILKTSMQKYHVGWAYFCILYAEVPHSDMRTPTPTPYQNGLLCLTQGFAHSSATLPALSWGLGVDLHCNPIVGT